MNLVKIGKIAKYFGLSDHDAYNVLLRHGNKIRVKLMHEVNECINVPDALETALMGTIEALSNSLTDYRIISASAKSTIPFTNDPYVYYLFKQGELVYIGQSVILPMRIGTHVTNRVIFDYVYCEIVSAESQLLMEKLYIHRDMPKLNIAVMENLEYFRKILELTDIAGLFAK